MFAAYCPTRARRVLLGPRRIRELHNTSLGILVELECCEGERVRLLTGRAITDALA